MTIVRKANHAGSWYPSEGDILNTSFDSLFQQVRPQITPLPQQSDQPVRVIISPHAGYRYSGVTAVHAFSTLNFNDIDVVYVLGPSHKVYLDGCALTEATELETPLGSLRTDQRAIQALYDAYPGEFTPFQLALDEDEHSLEMQYPLLAKRILDIGKSLNDVTVVPIVVGALDDYMEKRYGIILSTILKTPRTACIISSDFCHWGGRFQYMPYNPVPAAPCTCSVPRAHHVFVPVGTNAVEHAVPMPWTVGHKPKDEAHLDLGVVGSQRETSAGCLVPLVRVAESVREADLMQEGTAPLTECPEAVPIHQSIEALDRVGMHLIERVDLDGFKAYLKKTKNSICGRSPIKILLSALDHLDASYPQGSDKSPIRVKFVHYAQSSSARTIHDSSVSYAAGVVQLAPWTEILNEE